MTMLITDAEHVFTCEDVLNRKKSNLCSPSRRTMVLP
jgi:hypothetical protein